MSTDTLERLPNTVTRCHALIRELQGASANEGELAKLRDEIEEKDDEIEDLGKTISAHEERIDELENIVEERADPIAAIERFLDECERTGPLRFDVPQSDRANNAIINLHDAAGRNP